MLPCVLPMLNRRKAAVSRLIAISFLVTVIVSAAAVGTYYALSAGNAEGGRASVLRYNTTSTQIPSNATIHDVNVDSLWPYIDQIKSQMTVLVCGEIIGIVNASATQMSDGLYNVQTNFVFLVNFSLAVQTSSGTTKSIPNGSEIVVVQDGGIASTGPNVYINETYATYPLLTIGQQYVLALRPFTTGNNNQYLLLGPDSIFFYSGGLVYSPNHVTPGVPSDWNLNGVTTNGLANAWNSFSR